jgi:hypothetical protein
LFSKRKLKVVELAPDVEGKFITSTPDLFLPSGGGFASNAASAAASAVASAVGPGHTEYASLCDCSDTDDGTCRCGQRQRQIRQVRRELKAGTMVATFLLGQHTKTLYHGSIAQNIISAENFRMKQWQTASSYS